MSIAMLLSKKMSPRLACYRVRGLTACFQYGVPLALVPIPTSTVVNLTDAAFS